MVFIGMGPFGALFAAFLAERMGAPLTVGIGAIACIAGGVVFLIRIPRLRNQARALIAAQALLPADTATDGAHRRT